jgi:hypothetical protein
VNFQFNFQTANPRAVIASVSEAIQGNKQELDCFVASAPRNDVDKRRHAFAFSRHDAPELCISSAQKNQRAQETPGARCTHGPCAKGRKHTVVTTGTPEHRHFLRNGFNGLFRALLGDEFVLSPSPAD